MENMLEGCPCCLWYHLSAVCKIREGQKWNWEEAWVKTEEQPERKMGRWDIPQAQRWRHTGREAGTELGAEMHGSRAGSYIGGRERLSRDGQGVGVRLRARYPSTRPAVRNQTIRGKQKLRTCPRDGCLGTKGGACFADTSSWSSTDATQHFSG